MKALTLIALLALTSSLGFTQVSSAKCHAVTVAGCGKQEKICVDNSTEESAQKKSTEAFQDKNGCDASTVKGKPVDCSTVKCDLRVGA